MHVKPYPGLTGEKACLQLPYFLPPFSLTFLGAGAGAKKVAESKEDRPFLTAPFSISLHLRPRLNGISYQLKLPREESIKTFLIPAPKFP